MEKKIIGAFKKNPKMTTRKAGKRSDLPSRTTIQDVLKANKFRPYKMRHINKLKGGSLGSLALNRLLSHLRHRQDDPRAELPEPSQAPLQGLHDAQPDHVIRRSPLPPLRLHEEAVVEKAQFPERLTVWAAIGKEGIIGPIFNPYGPNNTVTGESYLRMLKKVSVPHEVDVVN